jgi:hypothetical protein
LRALAAIHVARKQLGLDDDTARDLYQRVTGKRSLRDCSTADHERIVEELRRHGFRKVSKGRSRGLEGPFAKKLHALWIAAWNLGLTRDHTDRALTAFVQRQTGLDAVRFLRDPADARKAIEALKGWIARDGGVVWGSSQGQDFLQRDQGKIAWAQWRLLVPGATLMGNRQCLIDAVKMIIGRDIPAGLGDVSPAEWRAVMNRLGERIRARQTGG